MNESGDEAPQPDPERAGPADLGALLVAVARGDQAAFGLAYRQLSGPVTGMRNVNANPTRAFSKISETCLNVEGLHAYSVPFFHDLLESIPGRETKRSPLLRVGNVLPAREPCYQPAARPRRPGRRRRRPGRRRWPEMISPARNNPLAGTVPH